MKFYKVMLEKLCGVMEARKFRVVLYSMTIPFTKNWAIAIMRRVPKEAE